MTFSAKVDLSELKAFVRRLDSNFENAVANTVVKATATARTLAPKDTGALRASLYSVTRRGNQGGRSRAEARAAKMRPKATFRGFARNPKKYEGFVVTGIEYAGIVNARHPNKAFFMARARRASEPFFRAQVVGAVQRALR